MDSKSNKNFQPIVYALLITVGIVLGMSFNNSFKGGQNILFSRGSSAGFNKINDVVNYIRQEYVDTINQRELVNSSITQILQNLDPHSPIFLQTN